MPKKFKIEDHIRDQELWEFPMLDTFGEGLILKNHANENAYTYVHRNKDGYRDVTLDISSFRGSFGAVHYYG